MKPGEVRIDVFTNQLKEVVVRLVAPDGSDQTVRLQADDVEAVILALHRELAFVASVIE